MKIVIVGNGKVGYSLAEQLVAERHDVTVVDIRDQNLSNASDTLDLMVLQGNGVSAATLREAGADSADLLVATTNSDEVNMVCCLTAKNLGTRYTIARIRTPEYNINLPELRKNLKIDMVINPESSTASEITRLIRFPSAANIEIFCRGKVELMGFHLQEGDFLVGKPLYSLASDIKRLPLLFCAADRDGELIIPKGSFIPQAGDTLYLLGQPDSLDQFFRILGRYTSRVKKVFILGGGKVTGYLVPMLDQLGVRTKVVELREDRCRDLCDRFPNLTVIHGDGSDPELLESESLHDYDCFVALTDRDEDNFIISLYAQHENVPKVITKCNRQNYLGIARNVGLDSVISPKFITTSRILRVVRGMQNSQGGVMNSLHRIANGTADAMEFTVTASTNHLGVPLKDLRLRSNVLIGVIVRNTQIIIPEGSSTMQEGDRVIIVAPTGKVMQLNDIYSEAGGPA